MDWISTLVPTVVAGMGGVIGYIKKQTDRRIDAIETRAIKATIALEKKLDRDQVKEIISDKLSGICIILDEIKEDIKEIKYNSRNHKVE